MRYLLDTCVISDFIKGEPGTQARLKQTPPIDFAVSVITEMELRYGLQLNPQRAPKIEPLITSYLLKLIPNFELQIAIDQLFSDLIGWRIQHQNSFLLQCRKSNLPLCQ
jgi:predicted nucleic acid-binding protein